MCPRGHHGRRPNDLGSLDIGPLRVPLHEVSPMRLAAWIGRVVAVESPVNLDEVTLRICTAVGVGRSGSRIRAQVRRGVRAAMQQREHCRIDPDGFLWRPGHEACEVRRRDGEIPSSLRNPWRIAPKEIGTALIHAVRASYGITPVDAVRGGDPPCSASSKRGERSWSGSSRCWISF